MGLYEAPLSLLGFWMGTMLANFHMCGIMLVLRAVFNILVRNASPRGPMCFRCLMYSLCDVIYLYFICCILMDLFVLCFACLTVFVNCLVKQFVICLGVVVILLLNGMEVSSVGGGALLVTPCMVCSPYVVSMCNFAYYLVG